MVDGVNNSVAETEIMSMDAATGTAENWAGNGFYSQKRILQNTGEAARMANPATQRMWSFVNEDKLHYASKQPVGFKVRTPLFCTLSQRTSKADHLLSLQMMCKDFIPLLPKPDSLVGRRAPFATKHMWVTPYVDGQLFPAGKFVTQTPKAPEDSLEGWMKGEKPIAKKDIVSWISFGVTHLPRPEDFPVMPYEHISFVMKPVGFFKQNPSLDVPASSDIRSVSAFPLSPSSAEAACCKK